jgi:ABC-type anion transport system duplicated permease subunit
MTKIESAKFGFDTAPVEMMEMKGTFGLVETVESNEVTIPFQVRHFSINNTFE